MARLEGPGRIATQTRCKRQLRRAVETWHDRSRDMTASTEGRTRAQRYTLGTVCIVLMTLVWLAMSELLSRVQTKGQATILHSAWCVLVTWNYFGPVDADSPSNPVVPPTVRCTLNSGLRTACTSSGAVRGYAFVGVGQAGDCLSRPLGFGSSPSSSTRPVQAWLSRGRRHCLGRVCILHAGFHTRDGPLIL